MAAIPVQPIFLNDVSVKIGTDTYEASLTTVRFEPTSNIVRWKGMSPASQYAFMSTPVYDGTLTFAQDWTTSNSLSQYLKTNQGKPVTIEFKPKKPATGTAATVTATIIVAPGTIGGDIDTVATATIQVAVVGEPSVTIA
ncbi:hypothetical protein LXM50_01620 [Microbacterium sp. Au-Mic1]|uniref:hypothetical protein n=1 Tax=Microbacterium sp. Au-Mic1 TaxID=2906457 RepID=UPI001E4C5FE8|nr:hypothetical protein [Microbacterium sp. Au-Mic1]MCE4024665.1 hypothetical protein [Microbacterium sp. Au-Mic1]